MWNSKEPEGAPEPLAKGKDWAALEAIEQHEEVRRIFRPLHGKTVGSVLAKHLPSSEDLKLVEIGCGLGELSGLMHECLRSAIVQCDRTPLYLQQNRARNPNAQLVQADAYRLPFADASIDGVLGYSMFDTLHKPERSRDEVARVLRPGGKFIHFLDLMPDPAVLMEEFAREGKVLFSNPWWLRSPATVTDDPYVSAERKEVEEALQKVSGPMSSLIGRCLGSYVKDPLGQDDLYRVGPPEALQGLRMAVLELYEKYNVAFTPLYGSRYFHEKLECLFTPPAFTVQESSLRTQEETGNFDSSMHLRSDIGHYILNVGRLVGRSREKVKGLLKDQVKLTSILSVFVAEKA